ncbi:hypothetical protein ACLB2K_004691 [Fragaria x ananassa]
MYLSPRGGILSFIQILYLEGSLPFIAKEGSLTYYISDVGQTAYLYSHGAFLWSLKKHIPDVAMILWSLEKHLPDVAMILWSLEKHLPDVASYGAWRSTFPTLH